MRALRPGAPILLAAVLTSSVLGACAGLRGGAGRTAAPAADSVGERYARALDTGPPRPSRAARAWLATRERALRRAADELLAPSRRTLDFPLEEPSAVAWRWKAAAGQVLEIRLRAVDGAAEGPVFAELLGRRSGRWLVLASADTGGVLCHRAERTEEFILRVQPALRAGGHWELAAMAAQSLLFPVAGRDVTAIASRFGDPRDGGRRRHEGVDILAPRGTPALAAADGVVTRVGRNRLGGRTIWLETDGGLRLYYAHLRHQAVREGRRVRAGEVIGRVGSSGNAPRDTPHLHFGVYEGAARDPLPWLTALACPAAEAGEAGGHPW